ncbi:TonB-dependent receptor plug domain-containing protein [Winogradskyella sp. PG-2]|uniref:TonB-dependent receptor plug domain-containing protein n=1 Tax=Winogradskyella sp. PG-2 TaxID=754409 RepID=UPI0004587A49|nr:TonB-dependent receptor [Winogradskyella sp. PG-2]BAO74678.1 TonB-dependent receptor [Winogradskyella sp. PG-2]
MSLNKNNILLFFILFFLSNSQAQENKEIEKDSTKIEELNEVVVTATRTPRQLSSLPLPVTLISKKQIKQTGTIRMNEILAEQTGLIVIPDESGFEGLQIQGINSDYIMIMIDGVPLVGRSAGNFDLSRLTVGNIKQIEVVKGPSSALYGSEAMGGVVNIITEKPKSSKPSGNVSFRAGSFTQLDANVNINQKFEKLGYGIFINRFSSEGYDLTPETAGQTVSPFENYTLNGRLTYDFNDQLKLFSSTRFYTQTQENSFESADDLFEGDSEETEWNSHLRLNHEWHDKLRFEYEFYFTNYRANESSQSPVTGDVLFDSNFNQYLIRPEVRAVYNLKNSGEITTGLGYQYDELDRSFFDNQVNFNSQYIYAQWDVKPLQDLSVIVGGRFDNHSEYSNQFSPKLALRYNITYDIALKSSVGYGFKAPDFRQLFFDFTNSAVGYTVLGYNVALDKLQELEAAGQILDVVVPINQFNNPLKAESSIGINLGASYTKDNWNVSINGFRNDFKNLIDTQVIARKVNGQNVFSYRNFDEVFFTGVELDATYNWNENLRISGGYQLLYTYDKAQLDKIKNEEVFTIDDAGRTILVERSDYFGLVNRSRHTANLKIFYTIPKIKTNFNLRTIYRSKYGQFDTNGNAILDTYDDSFVAGFVTVNIAATKQFEDHFDLQVGARNFLNHTDNNIPNLNGIQLFTRLNYNF